MKANELMIGDWVKFDGRTFKLCDVTVINPITNPALVTRSYIRKDVESPTGCFNDALIIESALPLKDIYPIPLTAEILEKNGFCVYGDQATYAEESDYYGKPTALRVQCNKYGDLHIWIEYVYTEGREQHVVEYEPKLHLRTRYVHELQHALRLCGVEKEIVL